MQSFRPRSASSERQPKTSPSAPNSKRVPSPNIRRSSSVSSSSAVDSRPSKVFERKPSPKPQASQEKKQTPLKASEVQRQWSRLQEDLKRATEELEELKKKSEGSTQNKDRIEMLESEAEKAKESEANMLDSLFSQTKQLEQTKILLEEAKLEIRNLQEKKVSLTHIHAEEEIKRLRGELRLALEAEEKSKKAMDDFAIALKEVTSELAETKSDLLNAKASNSSSQSNEQKLHDVLEDYNKLKVLYEESAAGWKEKEDGFINCIKISEEEMSKMDQSHLMARQETSKLRDIIKQAVNESTVLKESLEIARYENYELNQQLSKKENALQQIKQDYESLRVSEASALDSVRELKRLLDSASAVDAEPFGYSKATNDDEKMANSLKKYASDRWKNTNPQAQNGRRHSVGELDTARPLGFEKNGGYENNGAALGYVSDADDEKKKKKKTTLRRFGDALRRRSFRKS